MRAAFACLTLVATISITAVDTYAQWLPGGVAVCSEDSNQTYTAGCSDGAGGAIIVWEDQRTGMFAPLIYGQRLNAAGVPQWAAGGIPVCAAGARQLYPAILADGSGGAFIAWTDGRLSAGYDLYAQRLNASGSPQWATAGVPLCTAQYDQFRVMLAPDGAGGFTATWNDDRWGMITQIYAQRVNGSGQVQWTANGIEVCLAASFRAEPQLVSDGADGSIITWGDYRSPPGGTQDDIYAQHVNGVGAVQWGIGGAPLCTAALDQSGPQIATDTAGGAYVVWNDSRADIYGQHVSAAGAALWGAQGTAVCVAGSIQGSPVLTADGSGGIIVAWQDRRSGSSYDIYAQHVESNANLQWGPSGIVVTTAVGDQTYPSILPDGTGGAIIAWPDERNGNVDIFAQRVANGGRQWGNNDVAIKSGPGDQFARTMVTDGAGGSIVAYIDRVPLPLGDDIYAQRLTAQGSIPTGVRETPPISRVSLSDAYPNPFSTSTTYDLTIGTPTTVRIDVFDAAGRRVRASSMPQNRAGTVRLTFDGLDDRAHALPSGVYFFRVHAGSETITKKMVIAR